MLVLERFVTQDQGDGFAKTDLLAGYPASEDRAVC